MVVYTFFLPKCYCVEALLWSCVSFHDRKHVVSDRNRLQWGRPYSVDPAEWPNIGLLNRVFGSILSVFQEKSKTQSSLNFLQSGPPKFTKSVEQLVHLVLAALAQGSSQKELARFSQLSMVAELWVKRFLVRTLGFLELLGERELPDFKLR